MSHRARWKIDNEKQMPIESRRAMERGRRNRSKKRQKEEEKGEEEEEEEAIYTFIPTHPALKHLTKIFKKYAKYTKSNALNSYS